MSWARIFRQLVVVFPVFVISIVNGIGYSWVSSNLPYLKSMEKGIVSYTDYQCTLLAMLFHIGRMSAAFVNILILSKLGRKMSIVIASSMFLISSGIIMTTKLYAAVAFSRLLNGIAGGIFECFCPIYSGEVIRKNIRGILSSYTTAFFSFGVLLQYILGIYLTYDNAAIVTLTLSIIMVLSTYCLIESPYFLSSTNPDKALKILSWINAVDPKQVEKELKEISSQDNTIVENYLKYFKKPEIYKSFAIMLSLAFITTILIATFISFANFILPDAKLLSSDTFGIFISIIPIIMSFLSAACIERVGRRPLLLVGFILSILLNTITTVLFYIETKSIMKIANFSWIIFFIIVIFLITYFLYINPPMVALCSEMFPISHKIVGASLTIIMNGVAYCLSTFFIMQIVKNYGMYLIFLVFCICSMVGLIIVHKFLPETKGKNLMEIQEILKGNTT